MKRILQAFAPVFILVFASHLLAQMPSVVVVLEEPGFPAVDTAPVPTVLLHQALPDAVFSPAADLDHHLNNGATRLLAMPYGSAFPLAQWPAILHFLSRGGNLLTLGGRAFTRPALFENGTWQLQPETYAFARQLLINDFQETPGSSQLTSVINQDEARGDYLQLRWQRAYSMVIRLSQQETSSRVGASGTVDSQLKTLLWGDRDGKHLAAPLVEIDHFQNQFAGGRWMMLNCNVDKAVFSSPRAVGLIASLAAQAGVGAELLRVTPTYALFLPNEPWQFELEWSRVQNPSQPTSVSIAVSQDGKPEAQQTFDLAQYADSHTATATLPTTGQPGFHRVDVKMYCGKAPCGVYRTAFWVRDEAYLLSGPAVSVDKNYFRIDGKPIEVVGTTYMASDAQRLYFRYPNPYVWDEDMKQIADAGMNMLRTGLWTDYDQVTGNTGIATERTRRTIEAFLMTARKHKLPVQFNLFAFMPEVFGGINPYLDPEAVRRESSYVQSMVQPFAHVPFLMWDLINEPSFDNPKRFFGTHANGDAAESNAWNKWLLEKYGSRQAVESAWKASLPDGAIVPPGDQDQTAQSANDDGRPLAVYDFNLFAQESFAAWAQSMRSAIRDTGSQQLITVGQDEGGALISPSPAYFKRAVDFTTMHSWWFNDDLLWDSLVSKQAGLPVLVQETGIMPEVGADGRPRRSAQADGALLEKKLGIAIGTGAGAIQWLWNINAVMRSQQEISIGAVRADGTEKPDAQVLRAYAKFARAMQGHLSEPEPNEVTILTSQAAQFSVLGSMGVDAQRRAVRAMNGACHIAAKVVTENNVAEIAGSKLVVLPSAQVLREFTWQTLMDYVANGGNLLLTGPVERDEHWVIKGRLKDLGILATAATLDERSTSIDMGNESVEATFAANAQKAVETLHLPNGQSYMEVKLGKGTVFLVAAPVELAESPDVATAVYRHVLARAGIHPAFEAAHLCPGVMVRAEIRKDSIAYLFVSESSADQDIDITDKLTRANLKFTLAASRTRLMLLDRATGTLLASYAGPEWAIN
jgi:hypothetical protein